MYIEFKYYDVSCIHTQQLGWLDGRVSKDLTIKGGVNVKHRSIAIIIDYLS